MIPQMHIAIAIHMIRVGTLVSPALCPIHSSMSPGLAAQRDRMCYPISFAGVACHHCFIILPPMEDSFPRAKPKLQVDGYDPQEYQRRSQNLYDSHRSYTSFSAEYLVGQQLHLGISTIVQELPRATSNRQEPSLGAFTSSNSIHSPSIVEGLKHPTVDIPGRNCTKHSLSLFESRERSKR